MLNRGLVGVRICVLREPIYRHIKLDLPAKQYSALV